MNKRAIKYINEKNNSSTDEILGFNKTTGEDFVISELKDKRANNKQMELSKYIVNKKLEYKKYLVDDIKNDKLLFVQDKVSNILDEDLNKKIDELINLLVESKYGTITFYYDALLDNVISGYKEKQTINKEKIELLIEMIDSYYDGVIGIENFFNIG